MTKLTLPTPPRCAKVLLAMVPPPPSQLSFGRDDNTHSTNANSSPTVLAHAIYQALKARASLEGALPAACVGGKDSKSDGSNGNGNACGGGQE